MKLLLDSNALLWAIFDRKRLSPYGLALLEDASNDLFVSMASIWEIAIKVAKGKLEMPNGSVSYVLQQIEESGMQLLQIGSEHILRTEVLPHIHGDPFDRMLIAQSLCLDLPVLTTDGKFSLYGVRTIE